MLNQELKYGLIIMLAAFSYGLLTTANATSHQAVQNFLTTANQYEKALFDNFPELGMYYGKVDVPQNKFMDHSYQGALSWQKTEDEFLTTLLKIKEDELINDPSHHTYQLLKQTLLANKATRVCKDELWNVNPQDGWQTTLTMVAQKQPVGNANNRKLALQRWSTVSQIVTDEINNLKKGIQLGYLAPQPVVERVIQQLDILIKMPIENSPFLEFSQRDDDLVFKKQMKNLVLQEIHPAIERYRDYLKNEYLAAARTTIGINSLPNGTQCYQAKILKETTLTSSPTAIYQYGLDHMRHLDKEVAALGQLEFSSKNMKEIFARAKNKRSHFFTSEQDMLNYNQKALNYVMVKMPLWFISVPTHPGIIKPYPLHLAQTGSPGEYHPPSDDGARPGIYYINTFEPHKKSKIDQEATLFHELIPGHHYQTILAYADNSRPQLNKYLWNAGFDEGWALYVERLADEMGLYSDNIARLGMLSNEALRTARLVVDPGIHVFNWSRNQAIDYLSAHTAMDQEMIESEVDRYIMSPGQATAYMLGKREIDQLRQLAQTQLGINFDIREFHHQLLKNGPITLPMLKIEITKWMSSS